jgi:sulfur relay (sulfurtransferase) DsrF/TusC family protein
MRDANGNHARNKTADGRATDERWTNELNAECFRATCSKCDRLWNAVREASHCSRFSVEFVVQRSPHAEQRRFLFLSLLLMKGPTHKPQEIPLDDPTSTYSFEPSPAKPFVATVAALEMYGEETVVTCLRQLQRMAVDFNGLDYLQVFVDPSKPESLWFIEDGPGGAITALLPSDY